MQFGSVWVNKIGEWATIMGQGLSAYHWCFWRDDKSRNAQMTTQMFHEIFILAWSGTENVNDTNQTTIQGYNESPTVGCIDKATTMKYAKYRNTVLQ